jgi:hypothetical protein
MRPTRSMRRERYIVIIVAHLVVAASYWYVAEPPNPWILSLVVGGILAGIGINRYKYRAGHFDQKS